MNDIWKVCFSWRDYAEKRADIIAAPLASKANREGRTIENVVDEYMMAVHYKHVGGIPVVKDGPTRVIDPRLGRIAALMGLGHIDGDKDE